MPNHFHLLLKQTSDNGISKFMGKTLNSYTRYFNTLNKRVGPLFQGAFKAVRIKTGEQLLHISRYIHLNPYVSNIVKDPSLYKWSSFNAYADGRANTNTNKKIVLELFKNSREYVNFVLDHSEYARELERIKHLVFEE